MAFNLDQYEPVEDRIRSFYEQHQNGRIITEILHQGEKDWVVKATIYRTPDGEAPASTGLAQEIIGSTQVNKTSALENCETSAIGRALANLGFAAKGRASREEMEKVQRTNEQPVQPVPPWLEPHIKWHGEPLVVDAVNDALVARGSKDGRWMSPLRLHELANAPQDVMDDVINAIAERLGVKPSEAESPESAVSANNSRPSREASEEEVDARSASPSAPSDPGSPHWEGVPVEEPLL